MSRAASLAKRLLAPENQISPEDLARLRPALAGVDDPDTNEDGTYKRWEPSERAITRRPLARLLTSTTDNWDDAKAAADQAFRGSPLVIFGAGESTLRHDLSRLGNLPVMGVNWTLKWFQPTYLHILDKQPFNGQIVENPFQTGLRTQVITCASTRDRFRNHGLQIPVLAYEVKDDSCGKYPAFALASKGSDLFQSFPNSLGYALQAATALGFTKIILIGFDFGGYHFFGDGRTEGTFGHYGEIGDSKQYLRPMLMAQAHYYALHGIRVVQVGPTKLRDCYPIVNSLEDALDYFH